MSVLPVCPQTPRKLGRKFIFGLSVLYISKHDKHQKTQSNELKFTFRQRLTVWEVLTEYISLQSTLLNPTEVGLTVGVRGIETYLNCR